MPGLGIPESWRLIDRKNGGTSRAAIFLSLSGLPVARPPSGVPSRGRLGRKGFIRIGPYSATGTGPASVSKSFTEAVSPEQTCSLSILI